MKRPKLRSREALLFFIATKTTAIVERKCNEEDMPVILTLLLGGMAVLVGGIAIYCGVMAVVAGIGAICSVFKR